MEITTLYQKTRREFGRSVNNFSITEPTSLGDGWPSDPKITASYVERDPTILELQAIPEMSEHEVNTERFAYVTHGMLHTEGGWPKDIDYAEKEQTTCARASTWQRRCRADALILPCAAVQAVPEEGGEGRGVHQTGQGARGGRRALDHAE